MTTNAIVQSTAKTITPVILAPVLILFGGQAYDTLFFLAGAASFLACLVALFGLVVGEPSPHRQRLKSGGV